MAKGPRIVANPKGIAAFKQNTRQRLEEAVKKTNVEIYPFAKSLATKVYLEAAQAFYDDYEPHVYKRKNSLTNERQDGAGVMVFSDQKMGAALDDDYITPTHGGIGKRFDEPFYDYGEPDHAFIYDIVFLGGYHGGPIWPWQNNPRPAKKTTPVFKDLTDRWLEVRQSEYIPKAREVLKKYMSRW